MKVFLFSLGPLPPSRIDDVKCYCRCQNLKFCLVVDPGVVEAGCVCVTLYSTFPFGETEQSIKHFF